MRRIAELLIVALAAFCLASCTKSFQDIKVTSCKLVSVSPRGLSAFDAVVEVGVDNPAKQITLSKAYAKLKMDGEPCLHLTADDVTLAARSEQVYSVTLHGTMDGSFNPFSLLSLLEHPEMETLSIDVSFRGALKSGLGKDFEYTDIPLKDLLGKL